MELTPAKRQAIDFHRRPTRRAPQSERLEAELPEAVALISCAIMEGAREGKTVAELMYEGTQVLNRADVMDGIAELIRRFRLRQLSGRHKLVTVHQPIV